MPRAGPASVQPLREKSCSGVPRVGPACGRLCSQCAVSAPAMESPGRPPTRALRITPRDAPLYTRTRACDDDSISGVCSDGIGVIRPWPLPLPPLTPQDFPLRTCWGSRRTGSAPSAYLRTLTREIPNSLATRRCERPSTNTLCRMTCTWSTLSILSSEPRSSTAPQARQSGPQVGQFPSGAPTYGQTPQRGLDPTRGQDALTAPDPIAEVQQPDPCQIREAA